jgi:hypothetical protein
VGYQDLVPPEQSCLSTVDQFENDLKDPAKSVLLLCGNFIYKAKSEIDLSNQNKAIICLGECIIDGSWFDEEEKSISAFRASGNASLLFCGIDFDNFVFAVSFSYPGSPKAEIDRHSYKDELYLFVFRIHEFLR